MGIQISAGVKKKKRIRYAATCRVLPWKTRRRITAHNSPLPRWASNWWRPRHSFRDSPSATLSVHSLPKLSPSEREREFGVAAVFSILQINVSSWYDRVDRGSSVTCCEWVNPWEWHVADYDGHQSEPSKGKTVSQTRKDPIPGESRATAYSQSRARTPFSQNAQFATLRSCDLPA